MPWPRPGSMLGNGAARRVCQRCEKQRTLAALLTGGPTESGESTDARDVGGRLPGGEHLQPHSRGVQVFRAFSACFVATLGRTPGHAGLDSLGWHWTGGVYVTWCSCPLPCFAGSSAQCRSARPCKSGLVWGVCQPCLALACSRCPCQRKPNPCTLNVGSP